VPYTSQYSAYGAHVKYHGIQMSKILPPNELAETLVRLRKERGWDQQTLAARMGKSQPEVSRWERGKLHPTYATVLMWAETLGVDVGAFLEGEERSEEGPDLDAKLGSILTSGLPALAQALLVAEIAAAHRAEALREVARAARIEAEKAPDRQASWAAGENGGG
jgi:transcriptional regulator with XRE-family HTH domain